MKYLVLKFEGAKKFIDKDDNYVRFDVPHDTLHVDNVYNCLAVLFGERPISKRNLKDGQLKMEKVDRINNLADGCMVSVISDNMIHNTKTGNVYPRTEILFTTRFKNNSWFPPTFDIFIDGENREIKSLVPSWFIMEKYLTPEQLQTFVKHAVRVCSINNEEITKMKMVKIFELVNQNMDDEFREFLFSLKMKPLFNILCDYKKGNRELAWHPIKSLRNYSPMVLGTPKSYMCLSGNLYVPFKDEMLELLCRGSMMSNVLDGGLVTVQGVEDIDITTINAKPVYKGV